MTIKSLVDVHYRCLNANGDSLLLLLLLAGRVVALERRHGGSAGRHSRLERIGAERSGWLASPQKIFPGDGPT